MRKTYALVNRGDGNGWICMSFENKKELLSFCSSYQYQKIKHRELKKYSEITHVSKLNDQLWSFKKVVNK